MTDIVRFDPPEAKPNIIKVMGVGGGGNNAVTHMFLDGITGVDFMLCNTDDQALQKSPVVNKLHIGDRALGAGNVPKAGREAAESSEEKIKEALGDETRMLFITAGMGGGTGTGAAPVVAKISHEKGILTVGIVTLPFSFEGNRRRLQAEQGIAELKKYVDALLVISNDKLREEYGDMKLTDAFKKADDVLKVAAKGIAEIITVTGYVNVDFEDVKNVMQNSGKTIMGAGYAKGENRALRAVEEAVHSPLLDDSDITGAKNILAYITSGTEEVSLDEVTNIVDYVQDATGHVSEVIWGNGEDMTLEDGIRVTLIATGFEDEEPEPSIHVLPPDASANKPIQNPEPHPKPEKTQETEIHVINKNEEPPQQNQPVNNTDEKAGVKRYVLYDNDNEEVKKDEKPISDDEDNGIYQVKHKTPSTSDYSKASEPSTPTTKIYDNPFVNNDDDVDVPGVTNMSQQDVMTMQAVKIQQVKTQQLDSKEELRRKRMHDLSYNSRNIKGIEDLENEPAYKRLGINVNADDESQLSHTTLKKNVGLSEDNSYINANVD